MVKIMNKKEHQILSTTRKFKDPVNQNRWISGRLLGYYIKNDIRPVKMEVLFYKYKQDKESYWKVEYIIKNGDDKSIPYHRRPLYRGLLNNVFRKFDCNVECSNI